MIYILTRKIHVQFLLIFALCITTIVLNNHIFNFKELLFENYHPVVGYERAKELVNYIIKFQNISTIIDVLLLIIKIIAITLLLKIGCLFTNFSISFKNILSIVINSELIIILGHFFNLFYFWFANDIYTLESISTPPFSVLALFNPSEVEPWLRYPFSLLNIFEVFYWVALIS